MRVGIARRIGRLVLLAATAAGAILADPSTLWVGMDPFAPTGGPILNTTTSGAILRTTDPFGGTGGNGIAVDQAGNAIYIARFNQIQKENLTTLAPIGGVYNESPAQGLPEDMTFALGNLWRTSYLSNEIDELDPATGNIIFSFSVNPARTNGPVGIAYDGTGFWIGGFNNSTVEKYTTTGVDTGLGFNPVLVGGPLEPQNNVGGLGYDPLDGTLYIGTGGRVYHYTTTGTALGFFNTTDARFVDGLEVQAGSVSTVVPEPSALALLGTAMAVFAFGRARSRKRTLMAR